jgi:hypothetical protein
MGFRRVGWFKIILCPVLLGGFLRLNEHYLWTSFRGLSVEADNPALERRFWDVFPSRSSVFWPFFVWKSRDVRDYLERTLPVFVRIRAMGFGSVAVEIKMLSPRALVEWRGGRWCVSREGRMWNADDGNTQLPGLRVPWKPLWRISSLSEPEDEGALLPGGVFPSPVSIDSIDDFLSSFSSEAWFVDVREISLERRAGAELFRLRLVRGEREFTILIQRDKYEGKALNETLRHVLESLFREGGGYLVDATYKNKIVVKDDSSKDIY